ncbi:MAG: hypothetical protein A2401_00845 [Candidatus Staskawiczbacteria bacterium RIFOXYC1_FULL_38_18]|uniref:Uncharacterized protein n=1 Tax=Candidatus Staskawiczbacteria bacterium RIFOXYC1_FULL_38_18 TaxID=1802229 RepID=A0A1G2JCC0_9BACT|nr:MAG: hypothetical protein A2401_00845 [Candidatus Staskawiczbacteria bacterium RIFOXYC1_FULL_38_18]
MFSIIYIFYHTFYSIAIPLKTIKKGRKQTPCLLRPPWETAKAKKGLSVKAGPMPLQPATAARTPPPLRALFALQCRGDKVGSASQQLHELKMDSDVELLRKPPLDTMDRLGRIRIGEKLALSGIHATHVAKHRFSSKRHTRFLLARNRSDRKVPLLCPAKTTKN